MGTDFQLAGPAAQFSGGGQAVARRPEGGNGFEFEFKLHRAITIFFFHNEPSIARQVGQKLSNLEF
jgi:hypothetical protein